MKKLILISLIILTILCSFNVFGVERTIIYDNFSDGSIDTNKWITYDPGTYGSITEASNKTTLLVEVDQSTTDINASIKSTKNWAENNISDHYNISIDTYEYANFYLNDRKGHVFIFLRNSTNNLLIHEYTNTVTSSIKQQAASYNIYINTTSHILNAYNATSHLLTNTDVSGYDKLNLYILVLSENVDFHCDIHLSVAYIDVFSVNYTEGNIVPNITSFVFYPAIQIGNQNQTFNITANDINGDKIYNYTKWYRNGVYNSSWDNYITINSTHFNKADVFTLELWVGDGDVNSTHTNHSTSTIGITECSLSDEETLSLMFYDEDEPANTINVTAEMEGTFESDGIETTLFSYNWTDNYSYSLCLYPAFETIYADIYIKHKGPGNVTNRYYIFNGSFTNVSQTINLYNFETDSSLKDLKITVRDKTTYQYAQDVVGKLQRKYLGIGEWKTVQMAKTDDFGTLLYKIVETDNDYKLIFEDTANNIIFTTESSRFLCTTDICNVEYLIPITNYAFIPNTLTIYFTYNNETGNITTYWSDPSGDTTIVETIVTKETFTGTVDLCAINTSSSSGNHTCNIAGHTGSIYIRAGGFINGVKVLEATTWISAIPSNLMILIGPLEGALWAFMLILTITMAGIYSPVTGLIMMIFGLLVVAFLGIFSPITIPLVIIVGVMSALIGFKIKQ